MTGHEVLQTLFAGNEAVSLGAGRCEHPNHCEESAAVSPA